MQSLSFAIKLILLSSFSSNPQNTPIFVIFDSSRLLTVNLDLAANKRTWESETWNGDKEPVFTTLGKPKLGLDTPKDNGGGGIIMAVILLILLICVAIFLVHKRQQMIKVREC